MGEGGVQFEWGEKTTHGVDPGVQFYGSFTYDGVKYSQYDCVYLYKEDEPEPFIGKLLKIWERRKTRKVKVLWFFRPVEIQNFMGDHEMPLSNELFLACGEGQGLFDINSLECIGGKCRVICTSMDQRNRQPSDEELKVADYIFYRTFDVGSCTISREFGEKIAGVEVKHIFNSSLVEVAKHGADETTRTNWVGEKPPQNPNLTLETQGTKAINELEGRRDSKRSASMDLLDSRNSKKFTISDAPKIQNSSMVVKESEDDASRSSKKSIVANESEEKLCPAATEKSVFSDTSKIMKSSMVANGSEEKAPADTGKSGFSDTSKIHKNSMAVNGSKEKTHPALAEKIDLSDFSKSQKTTIGINRSKEKTHLAATENLRFSDSFKSQKASMTDDVSVEKADDDGTQLSHVKNQKNLENESPLLKGAGLTRKLKSSKSDDRMSDEMLGKPMHDVPVEKEKKVPKAAEVPRRPRAETSKFFSIAPWETRILEAQQHGTLVLLENFDPFHTSEEIEDLIYHFFQKQCSGRVIESSMFSGSYTGRALIICKTRGDAEEIVRRLKEKVLLLSNGRPLMARVMPSRRPREESTSRKFNGHFILEKTRQREELRKAVSTSHCSQPNTLEYELAMDWIGLHEKAAIWWKMLHSEHERDAKEARPARRIESPSPVRDKVSSHDTTRRKLVGQTHRRF